MSHTFYSGSVRRLLLFSLLLLFISQAAISLFAWSLLEEKLLPEMDRQATTVGRLINAKLQRALDYKIPFDQITGIEEFFDDIREQDKDVRFLAISDPAVKLLHVSGIATASLSAALNNADASTSAQHQILRIRHTNDASKKIANIDQLQPTGYRDTTIDLRSGGKLIATVHVGMEQDYFTSKITDLRYDIGIILLTSLLIAFEILLFIITRDFSVPLHQISALMAYIVSRDFRHQAEVNIVKGLPLVNNILSRLNQLSLKINDTYFSLNKLALSATSMGANLREASVAKLERLRGMYVFSDDSKPRNLMQPRVNAIRILTFLFMFAEMLSRPFLPLYAKELIATSTTVADTVLVSLPITGFLLGMAVSMPFAGLWSDRVGRRYSFIAGALTVAAGLLISGGTAVFTLLVLARTITGIGYATMFMSCQGYVLDQTRDQNRAQGMAAFVSAIMVAEICAPAIGGILADRIGVRLVFIFGAVIATIAALLAINILDNKNARRPDDNAQILLIFHPFSQLIRNHRFIALSILSGIPAKLIYSGFLIYLLPLLLTDLSSTKSEIGRYAMAYGVAALLLSPLFARLTDRYQAHVAMVILGGLLTGAGLIPIYFVADKSLVLLGVAALGIGQAMSISAQITLVGRLTAVETNQLGSGSVLGVFRLIERTGAAAGPLIAGALVALFGVIPAMALLGLYGLLSALLFAMVFHGKKPAYDSMANDTDNTMRQQTRPAGGMQ